jgi:MOSC domain-containing protein YiiM
MGKIASIVYRPEQLHPKDHFSRVPLQTAVLLEGKGIEGDRKGENPARQLNIMSRETLDALAAEGFKTQPGQMGEQIVVSGLDVDLNTLPEGAQIQLGDAVIEVYKPRTGCDRFEAIQGLSPKQAVNRLGVIAGVIKSGTINVGDPVVVLEDVRVRHS